MYITCNPNSIEDYRTFLAVKRLPHYAIHGRSLWCPDEYADRLGVQIRQQTHHDTEYEPPAWMWDYQQAITKIAIRKRKYAIFADCGLGKTPIFFEFARHAQKRMRNRGCLIVSPLNVLRQTINESEKFYGPGGIGIEQVRAAELQEWIDNSGGRIGITNYEALKPGLRHGRLGAMILDESAYLKSHYGKWGQVLLRLGKACDWKLCCTGTPAPNDRIEFANHAVFLDSFRNVNAFLATFFVNRGQTDNRWELKAHATTPFYRALSHWCIFLTDPATYGWHDNTENIPPIIVHMHEIPMTQEQTTLVQHMTGELISVSSGGIAHRGTMGQIGKGWYKGQKLASNKSAFIDKLIDGWKREESSIVWCLYNAEQQELAGRLSDSANVTGATPYEERMEIIDGFKSGQIRTLVTKPKILGLGLNLQVASRQIFSGLQDCFDESTEVLTRDGWIGFDKLKESDHVATTNPHTLQFEWQLPSRVVWKQYAGPMVRFEGQRNFDLLVTPNHRIFVTRCKTRFPNDTTGWHFRYANHIAESFRCQELRMQSCPLGGFIGNIVDVISNDMPNLRAQWTTVKTIDSISTDLAVRLAAWYLTEGHCRPVGSPEFGRITICQTDKNPENRSEIIDILTSIVGHVDSKTKDIKCYSRHLAGWLLREFGHGSHFKRMPSWLKDLDTKHLQTLRDTMMKGDGISYGRSYRTASKLLADDFQEICLKTGWRASVKSRIGVCAAYPNDEIFDVTLAKEHTQPAIFTQPTIEHYIGMIGCATVPNGTLIVRRNGIPVVSGNSYESYYQAVKRSNRYGSTKPLNVHIPLTDVEEPMVQNVLRKAKRVQLDTEEQERIFKESSSS